MLRNLHKKCLKCKKFTKSCHNQTKATCYLSLLKRNKQQYYVALEVSSSISRHILVQLGWDNLLLM